MITVYADVLFLVNFFMNYLLLKLTAIICGEIVKLRLILAALIGSAFCSLIFFAEDIPLPLVTVINLLSGFIMLIISFGVKSKKEFFRTIIIFLCISFLFAGITFLIFLSGNAFISNGSVYFSANFSRLFLASFISFYVIKYVCKILNAIAVCRMCNVRLEIYSGESYISVTALSDTGNSLCDPFSGLPVCILQRNVYKNLSKENSKIYIVPYKTINKKGGILTGFKPDLVIITDINGNKYTCECIVAVTDTIIKKGTEAIINPVMLTGLKNNEKTINVKTIHT